MTNLVGVELALLFINVGSKLSTNVANTIVMIPTRIINVNCSRNFY